MMPNRNCCPSLRDHSENNWDLHPIDLTDHRIVADLGQRPQLKTVENPEHGEWARTLADRSRIEELREDITRAEDAMSRSSSPTWLFLGLIVTFLVELLGAILIMGDVGVEPRERLPLSFALALAVIGLTAVAAKGSSPPASESNAASNGHGAAPIARRTVFAIAVLGAYTLLVGAIAVVRVLNALDEEAATPQAFSNALILLATGIGPAWCAEALLRRWRRAVPMRKHLKVLRKRMKNAERDRARAQAAVNRIAREGAEWDGAAARRRALYATHHRLESAKGNS
jgi:hypothetical protein